MEARTCFYHLRRSRRFIYLFLLPHAINIKWDIRAVCSYVTSYSSSALINHHVTIQPRSLIQKGKLNRYSDRGNSNGPWSALNLDRNPRKVHSNRKLSRRTTLYLIRKSTFHVKCASHCSWKHVGFTYFLRLQKFQDCVQEV